MRLTNSKGNDMEWTKTINKGEQQPTLAEAQAFVGGWVERFEFDNGDLALCDEEGLMKGYEVNPVVWDNYAEMLVGKVIIIKSEARDRNSEEGWG